jgi:aryl-alcohol dehydrogenase-like predicted oxidoreductase
VAAPVIGGTKIEYVEDGIKLLDVTLTEDDIKYLEELYLPHKVVGAL